MQWNKDTIKQSRIVAKLSQHVLADELEMHWRTVHNCDKGTTPIPTSILLAFNKLLGWEHCKFDKVVFTPTPTAEALNSANELDKTLSDIILRTL